MPVNLLRSSEASPLTYAVISVPLGIFMSLPFIKRKKGAAGKNKMLVATIAPVITAVEPLPLVSFTARKAIFSPVTVLTESILISSLPPFPIRPLGLPRVTVPRATPPRGMTTISPIFTSSSTSKSIVSPVLASAEDMFRLIRNLSGVPSCNPKASGSFGVWIIASGTGAGDVWASRACEVTTKILHTNISDMNLIISPVGVVLTG